MPNPQKVKVIIALRPNPHVCIIIFHNNDCTVQELVTTLLASTGNVITDNATVIWFAELDKTPILVSFSIVCYV